MEWLTFFMAASATSLIFFEMEKNKKLEQRIEELEKKIQS